mmetsp:Transcript_123021/g.244850  ORF Transcript_123021/g.244850 Transcript_123021/m.244850 type:complete len:569 (+) Transcript_123021:68-1774(+)
MLQSGDVAVASHAHVAGRATFPHEIGDDVQLVHKPTMAETTTDLQPGATEQTEQFQALVTATFNPGEVPLGLVMDWSMALPVVSGVLSRSPASRRPQLRYGLVLVHVNGEQLRVGLPKPEVERRLAARPLELSFEAPAFELIGDAGSVAWRQPRRRHSPMSRELQSVLLAPVLAPKQLHLQQDPSERIGLSRFGNISIAPPLKSLRIRRSSSQSAMETPHQQDTDSFSSLSRVISDPFLNTHAKRSQGTRESHLFDAQASQETGITRHQDVGSDLLHAGSCSGKLSAIAANHLWQDAGHPVQKQQKLRLPALPVMPQRPIHVTAPQTTTRPCVDPCYEHLLDGSRPWNTRPTGQWPLGHEASYACHLDDLILVTSLRAAFDVGFRGEKRQAPTALDLQFPECVSSPRQRSTTTVEVASCDRCGNQLASTHSDELQEHIPNLTYFYFCRSCKRNGRRFELCLACHAIDVLHAEGKYAKNASHPHYLRCCNVDLVKYRDIRAAYPLLLHLESTMCDHCGGRVGAPRSSGLYVCPHCPEVYGLRFELCVRCAKLLLERGSSIKRLRALHEH